MKTKVFVSSIVLLLSSAHVICAAESGAHSLDASSGKAATQTTSSSQYHAYTLEEARKNAHAYTDKLDKMTPEEWDDMQKKRAERMKQWENMTPEQRAAAMRRPGIMGRMSK